MLDVGFSFSATQDMYDVRGTRYDLKIPAPPARCFKDSAQLKLRILRATRANFQILHG